MRADAETTGPLIDHDLLVPTAAHQLARVARRTQRDDAGPVPGSAAAEDLQARPLRLIAQVIRQLQYALRDGGNADLQQQLQARSQSHHTGDVERAALPASGVRLEAEVDPPEVERPDHTVPADADRMQQ